MTRVAAKRINSPGQIGALGQFVMTEAELQHNVVGLARRLGYDLVFHAMQPWHAAERGWPDLVLVRVRDRRLLFVELKTTKGEIRPDQERVLGILRGLEYPGEGGAIIPLATSMAVRVDVKLWRPADWHSGEIERVLR